MNNDPITQNTPDGQKPLDTNASAQGEYGRDAAIHFARSQVDTAYEQAPPNQLQETQPAQEASYDWQQYHNAWQQYYQQYYQRYYFWQSRHHQPQGEKVKG